MNKSKKNRILNRLETLYKNAPVIEITDDDQWVIFSDLHMGNGGDMDDFEVNARFFPFVLKHYYNPGGYNLVLNGDVEELHRFHLEDIHAQWKNIYNLFEGLAHDNRLFKIVGNHDYDLWFHKKAPQDFPLYEALTLRYHDNNLFIFHGHQAAFFSVTWNRIVAYTLRFLATPLGIKNYVVAYNSKKKFKLETRIYEFARAHKIPALIGHTHRPLFESLSKIDSLKFQLETLCRQYPAAPESEKESLTKQITEIKNELEWYVLRRKGKRKSGSLYASEPLVPSLFNSGCTIGRRGMTSIEISKGMIRLVFWFDKNFSRKYFDFSDYQPEQLEDSDYYRVVLKEEPLSYIFTRINLLS